MTDAPIPSQMTAYHIIDGPTLMYNIDAKSAAGSCPDEWSLTPWSAEDTAAARQRLADRRQAEIDNAKAQNLPLPPPLRPAPALSAADQAAIDEYNTALAAAKDRLAARAAAAAEQKVIDDQIKADEALVASPPPVPDPAARRPVGRPGRPPKNPAVPGYVDRGPATAQGVQSERARLGKLDQATLTQSDRDWLAANPQP